MKRILVAILTIFFLSIALQSQITVTIDIDNVKGEAGAVHYGTNIFGGNDTSTANNELYQNSMKLWNPGFLRFHSANHNRCDHKHSWLDCENKTWDKEKIKDVLEEFIPEITSGDKTVITIFNYPPWKEDKDIAWYAEWCAQLVDIVILSGFFIAHW